MKKLKEILNSNESGQVLIIVLLVLVVGVSIVLSLSARSLTDIRTTTSTEQSNRAYFAAEAGIERALQQIKDTSSIANGTAISGSTTPLSNQAQYTGSIEITGGSTSAFYYDAIKDQTVQVNLKPNINQNAHGAADFGLGSGRLSVLWHVGATPTPSHALEISILRVDSAGSYVIDRLACDKDASHSGNGLNCTGPANMSVVNGGNNCSGTAVPVSNKGAGATVTFCNAISFNVVPQPAGNYKAILMRVRPICYAPCTATTEAMGVRYYTSTEFPGGTAGSLSQQGYKITSTGSSPDGASRKLEVYRSFPSLPTVFDFVLYNGSSNALTKP